MKTNDDENTPCCRQALFLFHPQHVRALYLFKGVLQSVTAHLVHTALPFSLKDQLR
jgi:hypothetical protein